jgi:hypothetical protein
VLQVVNSAAAAGLVALIFLVLAGTLGTPHRRAAVWALVAGATYGVWWSAGAADIYGLAVPLAFAAWALMYLAFTKGGIGSAVGAGLAWGVAMTSHQFTGPLGAAALAGLLSHPALRARPGVGQALGAYLTAAVLSTVVGYAALGSIALGEWSPSGIVQWMTGYAGDPTYGYLSIRRFGGSVWAAAETIHRGSRWWPIEIIWKGLLIAAVWRLFTGLRRRHVLRDDLRIAVRSCAAQCAIGIPLLIWWEGSHLGKFWLFILVAAIVLGEGAVAARDDATRPRVERGLVAACVALFLLNGAQLISERRGAGEFDRALDGWMQHTTRDDVLIESGEMTPHLRFWADRPHAVHLYRVLQAGAPDDPFRGVTALIDEARRRGAAVFYATDLGLYYSDERLRSVGTDRRGVEGFFRPYLTGDPLFSYRDQVTGRVKTVYRLARVSATGAG